MTFRKEIVFFYKPAVLICDGVCSKAWGINHRPVNRLSPEEEDPDDYESLADGELGEAPANPGTYEGGYAKPVGATSGEDMNKWCCRECERSSLLKPGEPEVLKDFSVRRKNKA